MLCAEINRSFIAHWKAYCKDHGVDSVPFWKIDILSTYAQFSHETLRLELVGALLSQNFDASDVPAFFVFLQTHASEFNNFLWAGTVAPRLASTSNDESRIYTCLKTAYFYDALYGWFTGFRRLPKSSDRSGPWYVRTVIAECGLCSATGSIGKDFYEKMFTAGLQPGELSHERAGAILIEVMSNAVLNDDEKVAVQSLADFFVDTGLRAAQIARFFTEQIPPPAGWSMESLLHRAMRVMNLSLTGLPRQALFLVESYIERQFQKVTLSQILAMFRLHPHCEVMTDAGPWNPSQGVPLPVAHGEYRLTNGIACRAIFVDDLYRGPDELAAVNVSPQLKTTASIQWRVDDKPFSVDNSNALRATSRPIYTRTCCTEPLAWVWTGPSEVHSGLRHSKSSAGLEPFRVAKTPKLVLRIWGWPTLDRDLLPAHYVKRYFADDSARVQLHYETAHAPVYKFQPSNGGEWATVKQLLSTTAGEPAFFTLRTTTGTKIDSQKRAWPLPALYVRRMRLPQGAYPRLTSSDEMILFASRTPEIEGHNVEVVEIPPQEQHSKRLGSAVRFRIKIPPDGRLTRLAVDGLIWKFASGAVPTLRMSVGHAVGNQLDSFRFRLVPDPICLSFLSPPEICLRLEFAPGSELSDNALRELIEDLTFYAGFSGAEAPCQFFQASALQNETTIERLSDSTLVKMKIASVLALSLSEPGLSAKRIALNVWNSERSDEDSETPDFWGHAVEFINLPYSHARSLPQTSTESGGLLLTDSSNAFPPLMLAPQCTNALPSVTDDCSVNVAVSGRLQNTRDLTLESHIELTRLGVWYTGPIQGSGSEAYVNLKCLLELLSSGPTYFLVFPPLAPERLLATLESGGVVLAEATVKICKAGANALTTVLPIDTNNREALLCWLQCPDSRLRFSYEDRDVGLLSFKHCPVVETWEVAPGSPNAAGKTTISVAVFGSAFPNLHSLKIRMTSPEGGVEWTKEVWAKSTRAGFGAEVNWHSNVFQSGRYRIELFDADDMQIAFRDVDVCAIPDVEKIVTLDEFLAVQPKDSDWTPETVSHFFRALRTTVDPWKNEQLICEVSNLLDKVSTESVRLLLKLLRAYLLTHSSGYREIIHPRQVPINTLADVGSQWLYLQRLRAPAVRLCLRDWEDALRVAALEKNRSEPERSWLGKLSKGARALQSEIATPAMCNGRPGFDFFPCRAEFSAWLNSLE